MPYSLNMTERARAIAFLVRDGLEVFDLQDFLSHCASVDDATERAWRQLKQSPQPSHFVMYYDRPYETKIAPDKSSLRELLKVDTRSKRLFAIPDKLLVQLCPEVKAKLEPLA